MLAGWVFSGFSVLSSKTDVHCFEIASHSAGGCRQGSQASQGLLILCMAMTVTRVQST